MITGTPGLPGMTIAGASAEYPGAALESAPATAIITHASERMEKSTGNAQSRRKVTHEQSNATSPGGDIWAVALTLGYRRALGWGASISAATPAAQNAASRTLVGPEITRRPLATVAGHGI